LTFDLMTPISMDRLLVMTILPAKCEDCRFKDSPANNQTSVTTYRSTNKCKAIM